MAEKNALQLLMDYGDDTDSSNDDVPGTKASTKRTYKEDKCRLPVPECLKKLKKDSEWTDIPSQHQGRIRSFQHERGNWAGFAYVPCESHSGLDQLVETTRNLLSDIPVNRIDDMHISLTKTLILKYHWIDSLVNSLKDCISKYKRFIVILGNLKVYCNEERTRTFIGLDIRSGHDTFLSLVRELDVCLAEFQLPQFYEEPSFHMSILWCLGDLESQLCQFLPQLNTNLDEVRTEQSEENWSILVNFISCNIGNKVFQFPLI